MTDEQWPFVDSDRHGWPEPDSVTDGAKLLYQEKLVVRGKRTDQEIARAAAEATADHALEQEFFKGILEVAKGSLDRSRASAEFVQKAAGAVGVIYTAVLGVAFSVAERPLPPRGVLPAIFLGVSIVCATCFLAWLSPAEEDAEHLTRDESPPQTSLRDRLAVLFIRWNRRAIQRRKWLRASVVALGAAIVLLPAPFVPLGERSTDAEAALPLPSGAAPGANIELRKILYQAQVSDAATTESEPITGDADGIWWAAAVILAALVVVLPQFPREPKQPSRGAADGLPRPEARVPDEAP